MTLDDVWIAWGRPEVLAIVGVGFVSVLLWKQPVLGLLFYPFRILNVFIHELSHVLVAGMTGGSFMRFEVNLNRSGRAYRNGGNTFFVAQAGYLGSPLVGGFLMLLTTTSIPARVVLIWMSLLLGLLCALFVANCFGVIVGGALTLALFFAGWQLDDQRADMVLLFLVVQMILAALDSLFDLVRYPKFPGVVSDAEKMESITSIPAGAWATLWCAIAIGILVWSVTVAYR
jgi:hypothetical protein